MFLGFASEVFVGGGDGVKILKKDAGKQLQAGG
jgi:hypothetical protein